MLVVINLSLYYNLSVRNQVVVIARTMINLAYLRLSLSLSLCLSLSLPLSLSPWWQAGQPPLCSSPSSHLALSPECCCNSAGSHWSPLAHRFVRREMTNLLSLMPCLHFPLLSLSCFPSLLNRFAMAGFAALNCK